MRQPATRVLFVCLGNICRSPLAEGVFRQLVRDAGLEDRIGIASAGTGDWHVGRPPDVRMIATARTHGVDLSAQRAQVLTPALLAAHDLVLVMDAENLRNARALTRDPDLTGRIALFRDFDPEPGDRNVPDPYYGGDEGFEEVYAIVERTARAVLTHLRGRTPG